MANLLDLLHQLREDAEAHAQQLEAGQFKVYSVALDGAQVECTISRAKIFRDFAQGLQKAIDFAAHGEPLEQNKLGT